MKKKIVSSQSIKRSTSTQRGYEAAKRMLQTHPKLMERLKNK